METDMNTLRRKIIFFIGLIMLFGQQTVFADKETHSHRDKAVKHWQKAHTPRKHKHERSFDKDRKVPPPFSKFYYQPGYRVNPLPHGHTRIFVNALEYYFYDGFFYRPSPGGYVVVESPMGAIIAALPRLHHIFHWHGEPYYVVGHTYYRKHPRGYIVVPDPGYGYRR
jgi:hypothetical protein